LLIATSSTPTTQLLAVTLKWVELKKSGTLRELKLSRKQTELFVSLKTPKPTIVVTDTARVILSTSVERVTSVSTPNPAVLAERTKKLALSPVKKRLEFGKNPRQERERLPLTPSPNLLNSRLNLGKEEPKTTNTLTLLVPLL